MNALARQHADLRPIAPAPVPPPPVSTPGSRQAGPDRRDVRFVIVPRDGIAAGVAAGLAHRLDVPVAAVRVAFVILAFAGGVGAILYLALWVLGDVTEPAQALPSGVRARRKAAALAPALLGCLLLLRSFGLWFGDGLVWPVALAGLGALVIGSRVDDESPPPPGDVAVGSRGGVWSHLLDNHGSHARRRTLARVGAGTLLVAVGMAGFLAATDALAAFGDVLPAIVATFAGLVLITGPVIYRLGRQLTEERRDRIRSQAQADMAAHLHDSVLQTLAMIQRSRSPRDMAALARAQERELRSWLFAGQRLDEGDVTLRSIIDDMVSAVEQRSRISVDAVVVGDAAISEGVTALIDACREALVNAAKHAGVQDVSLYVEVDGDAVTAFVRDAGRGFDPDHIATDRGGISGSIQARIERHGGRADVSTAPGEGTEWRLDVPLAR